MSTKPLAKEFKVPRPFLKWAGGKRQLLFELEKRLPHSILESGIIEKYVEPFVGGGAMFFYLESNYQVKKSFLLDVNVELIMTYRVIQKDFKDLISILKDLQAEHLQKTEEDRKENYYRIRDEFNTQMQDIDYEDYGNDWIERAAKLIFLNKTCFNGLFRLNSKGEFNVPFGRYQNPTICDEPNLKSAHDSLKKQNFCAQILPNPINS